MLSLADKSAVFSTRTAAARGDSPSVMPASISEMTESRSNPSSQEGTGSKSRLERRVGRSSPVLSPGGASGPGAAKTARCRVDDDDLPVDDFGDSEAAYIGAVGVQAEDAARPGKAGGLSQRSPCGAFSGGCEGTERGNCIVAQRCDRVRNVAIGGLVAVRELRRQPTVGEREPGALEPRQRGRRGGRRRRPAG